MDTEAMQETGRRINLTATPLPMNGTIWSDLDLNFHTVFGVCTHSETKELLVLHMIAGRPEIHATDLFKFKSEYRQQR